MARGRSPTHQAGNQDLGIVRVLSQYRPFERGGAGPREAQEDLLLASLAESGGGCASSAELRENVATLFRVDLHQAEVDRALGQLIREGRVERNSGYCLSTVERERLDSVAATSEDNAKLAMKEWRDYIVAKWPGLSGDQLDQLENQLRSFLLQVLRRHGAEATVLLYPDDPEAERRYEELEEAGFGYLEPTDSEVEEIQEAALSYFLRHPTEAQKEFLGQNLNTSYFLSVLSIDPDAAALVREIANGQVVFLDTNFVYRVLGIQGPRHVRAARTILETTRDLGYRCCVTPWTIEEFKRSLERARDYVHRYPVPASEYAGLLAETTSDEDFVTAYWRRAKESPIKIDDFYAHWREVEVHLEQLGIEVNTAGCAAIEKQDEAITDEISILAKALHGRYRHPGLLEHDVKHRLLVRRLRGDGARTFANGGYWFLTFDSVLPQYDHQARRGDGDGLPFCVSAGSWFQIIEAFRPKTQDVLRTLADLLASPYVRYRRTLSRDAAQAVVARVQLHEGADASLAARIMMNSAWIEEIEKTDPDSAERTELIDNAIVAAAKQAQADARKAQAEAEAERRRARTAQEQSAAELREAESRHADALARAQDRARESSEAERSRHAAELAEREEKHRAAIAQVNDEASVAAARERAARRRAQRRLRLVLSVTILSAVALILVLAVGLTNAWGILGGLIVVVGLAAALDQLWISRIPD